DNCFVIRFGPEARRPERVVSRRTCPGGSIVSEGIADRELEALGLVTPGRPADIAAPGVERHAETEAEKPQRRQPLHREADRAPEAGEAGEPVALRRNGVRTEELEPAAGLIHVAEIEERAHARGLRPFRGHREDELVLAGDAQITAIGVAELVLRAQTALAIAAHRVRAAAVELPVGRDGGGAAQGAA